MTRAAARTRWARRAAQFRDRYLTIDGRTAAVFRVVLATLLSLDLIRHWRFAPVLYSNEGVLSNHYHLFKPSSGHNFSLFHAFSTLSEVHVAFALGLVAHLCLLVGYRTRLAAVLSLLFVTSRDSRIVLVENGGYVVENVMTLWACFLPLHKRFSVDAWLASWRARKETTLEELAERADPTGSRRPVVTLAIFGAISNFAVIYFFNVVNKQGHIWRRGESVHYVLYVNRMVTGLAVFFREHMPDFGLRLADYVVLSVEAFLAVGMMWPRGRKWLRPTVMVLCAGLHGTFGTFMRLGPFSWFMIGFSTLLLLPVHFEMVKRLYERRTRSCEVALDVENPFALAFARVVSRLDAGGRVRFVPAESGRSLAVRHGDSWTADARVVVERVVEAIPLGRWFARAATVLSFGLAPWAARRIVERGDEVARWLGLDTAAAPEPKLDAPFRSASRRASNIGRELVTGYFMFVCTAQVYLENKIFLQSLPPPMKEDTVLQPDEQRALDTLNRVLNGRTIRLKPEKTPEIIAAPIGYLRIYQGWGMFAPNPPQDDGVLVVDAFTIDGRRLDPFTGKPADMDLTDSRGEALPQLWQDYGNRIRADRNEEYRGGLKDYLLRWPERTGRAEDEIVAFDVYWVRDRLPPPGSHKPYDNDPVPLLTWRKPNFKPPPGFPTIPPPPKVRSADKWDDKKSERSGK
ncbi:MAG: HTTM domain-containing protein [Polyangiaceae bacterium]